ncbi:MAG: secondary thiamine-phosphate synthase enzyme YjbQ [Candidatus Omnitrophica bacterium]|nr:secondary thiamine-phosphate synthase enzyme YjbQ [Candidatus Omnitrophota bacterium]
MAENNLKIEGHILNLSTTGEGDIIDITSDVQSALVKFKMKTGVVTCFIPGSTAFLTTIEYESGLIHDLPQLLEKLIPKASNYAHNAAWGDGNGFSHLRASLIGPSLSVPFKAGKLCLGTWQQIVFVECDNRARNRSVELQFIGY